MEAKDSTMQPVSVKEVLKTEKEEVRAKDLTGQTEPGEMKSEVSAWQKAVKKKAAWTASSKRL